jgi:hypothetical protein
LLADKLTQLSPHASNFLNGANTPPTHKAKNETPIERTLLRSASVSLRQMMKMCWEEDCLRRKNIALPVQVSGALVFLQLSKGSQPFTKNAFLNIDEGE